MKTIKKDESPLKVDRWIFNGTDLKRAFMNNVQVFGSYYYACFVIGDSAITKSVNITKYIYKKNAFGSINSSIGNLDVNEFSVSHLGDWIFKVEGGVKIENEDRIFVNGDGAYVNLVFEWSDTEGAYIHKDKAAGDKLIADFNAGSLKNICVSIDPISNIMINYDFDFILTGVQQ